MKVVQVLPALASGGVERGTLEVAKYLVEQGHQSYVISAGGRLVPELVNAGSQHIEWSLGSKSLLTFRHIWKLRKWLEENQIDILHVRSRMPAWICYLAWKGMNPAIRPKLITTVHGPYSVNRYSAVMTKGEKVIVISEMIRDYVLHNYQIDPQRLVLNYRGIDPVLYSPRYSPSDEWLHDWYQQYPQTTGKKLLCLPARITRWKGQTDFIELIAKLSQQRPDIHGLIVGETKKGKDKFLQELHALAAQKGVSEHISFTGHRSDLKDIMAISELVFSFSTAPEAFGRTTIEALSLGTPVIGYAHGGVAEQLARLLPAGQVKPNDIQHALTLADEWLKSPPDIAHQHPFKLSIMLANTLAIYQQCLEEH